MRVAARAPDAVEFQLIAVAVDVEVDEAQVLRAQLLPFRLEVRPGRADPEVIPVVARTPDARKRVLRLGSAADGKQRYNHTWNQVSASHHRVLLCPDSDTTARNVARAPVSSVQKPHAFPNP